MEGEFFNGSKTAIRTVATKANTATVSRLGKAHLLGLTVPRLSATRLKALERENRELRQANEILRKASAYFARAELDRRHKP